MFVPRSFFRFLGPDFRGANLTKADLSGAILKGADFRGAILDDITWGGAALPQARFDAGVSISGQTERAEAPSPEAPVGAALEAVQDLIRKAIADPRLAALGAQLEAQQDETGQVDPAILLESLRQVMASYGADVTEALRPFEQALAAVQSAPGAEPPEEWKAWLEGLMRNPPPAIAEIVSKLQQPPAKKPTNEETEG